MVRCPSIEQRFSACPDPNYGHICFYEDEWACGNRCISKKDVCKSENNSPQLKGNEHHEIMYMIYRAPFFNNSMNLVSSNGKLWYICGLVEYLFVRIFNRRCEDYCVQSICGKDICDFVLWSKLFVSDNLFVLFIFPYSGISLNAGCDWGMKRCGEKCVDRHTPCHGTCWDESSIHKCGDNMCLSQYQLQVSEIQKAYRVSPPCIFQTVD